MNQLQFVDYVLSFYGPGEIYDLGVTRQDVLEACFVMLTERTDASLTFCGDSFDREQVRDIMLDRKTAHLMMG